MNEFILIHVCICIYMSTHMHIYMYTYTSLASKKKRGNQPAIGAGESDVLRCASAPIFRARICKLARRKLCDATQL